MVLADHTYRIGEVAARSGLTRDTLRFYERLGTPMIRFAVWSPTVVTMLALSVLAGAGCGNAEISMSDEELGFGTETVVLHVEGMT